MEKLSQGLEWIGRKIWLLLRIFGLLVLAVLPDLILEESKSQVTLVIVGLMTLGLLVFFWWRAEKNDLSVWDPNILTWDGLAIVILAFAIMQLTDMLGYYLLELQGATTTENDASIIEFLKGVPFGLALLTTAFLPAIAEEVILRGYFFKKLFGSQAVVGIIVSSLLFGALHGPTDFASWLIYGGGGLIFCILYHKTGYLIYPIAVHFINNAWSVVAFYYFR
ncbi:CPBP family intramembrane glutamic endopeptidase [Streptococcus suis]|uniref:CPBP family intramembrane glutamic endopeptidase n=1 Tax=Streptococcus suis TaxID=1307 RepID=UPI00211ED5CD|nr:type II CAAX endopeptidase family protein [Streptococcus suis]